MKKFLLGTKEQMQKHMDEMQKKMKENPELAVERFADDGKLLMPYHDAICGKEGELFICLQCSAVQGSAVQKK